MEFTGKPQGWRLVVLASFSKVGPGGPAGERLQPWAPRSRPLLVFVPDPNTQILYACDSCGEKFLDANSLAQHVRLHTAQALVMFQADTDFYQQYGATTTWQAEQVIPAGEVLFRARENPDPQPALAETPQASEGQNAAE